MQSNQQKAKEVSDLSTYLKDLVTELYTVTIDGYKRGLVVGALQLKPLNVKIETDMMGKNLSAEKLKRLKELNRKYVQEWSDKLQGKIYDITYDGLEKGKTIKQITDEIVAISDKGVIEARKVANDIIIDAARRGEIDLYREAGVGLFRDIAIVDDKTCGVCLGLNGRIYKEGWNEKGLINYDNGNFLTDDIATLSAQEGLEDWIVPEDGAEGPQYHSYCRCHMAPVLTFEQYKGVVQTTISEV
jgi:hypothetical protein